MALHKLFWDDSLIIEIPEITTTVECGSNSIVATGLTDDEIATAKLAFQLLFQLKFWPLETPTLEEFAIVYQKLFGETL